MTIQLTGSPGLAAWREPDEFMRLESDVDGLNPVHLNCLNHCLREVLRGHGVASPLRVLARPLGLALVVDKTLRIWLLGQPELEWDEPRYHAGFAASWRGVRDEARFRETLTEILDSGRVGVLRATRWQVPWLSQAALAPSDWHASVFCGLDGDRIRVVDRQFGGTTTAARDMWVDIAEVVSTIEGGMAFLDYRHLPDQDGQDLVAALVAESAANLGAPPLFPGAGAAFGLDALDQLEILLSGTNFAEVDSRQLRMTLRWHLPSCVRKFVVGNRKVLALAVAAFAGDVDRYAELLALLEADCAAWDRFATATALAARKADNGIGEQLFAALHAVRERESRLLEELCRLS